MSKLAAKWGILCVFAAFLAVGCAGTPKSSRETVTQSLQTELYSVDQAAADRAALVLFSYKSDETFRLLKRALAETSPSVTRAAVMRAFTIQKDPRIRAEALVGLGDDDDEIVALSQTYLVDVIGTATAPDVLEIARDDRRPLRMRATALAVLGKIGDRDTVEGLLPLLRDGDAKIVLATTDALKEITGQIFGPDPDTWRSWFVQARRLSPEEWRRVAKEYTDKLESLEQRIATLEGDVAARDQELVVAHKRLVDIAMAPEAKRYPQVIDVLENARPIEAKIYAASALGKAKVAEAAPALIAKARSADPRLSKACIDALGQIGDAAAAEVVTLNLQAQDPGLRLSAVKAYAALSGTDLAVLLPLRADSSSEVRAAVMASIGNRGWQGGFEALIGAMSDLSPEVRVAAAGALGQIKDKEAVGALIRSVTDENVQVRWAAVYSLSLLADPRSFDALVAATGDADSGVREWAAVALAGLHDQRAVDRLFTMSLEDANPKAAERAWTSLMQVIGDDAAARLAIAERLGVQGRFDRAETVLKTLADATEETAEVWEARRRLAAAYLAAGKYDAAAVYFRRILDGRPDDREALTGLAAALKGRGAWSDLAGLCSRQIIGGAASDEMRRDFLQALKELMVAQDYGAVVTAAEQVTAHAPAQEADLKRDVEDIYGRALPFHIQKMVALLGSDEPVERAAARSVLAGYGKTASSALVAGLADGSVTVRTACLDILVPMAGGNFGFDPSREPTAQQPALEQWRGWLAAAAR